MAKHRDVDVLPPAKRHSLPLNTVGRIAQEQARVYRRGQNGYESWETVAKQVYVLGMLRSSVEAAQAEAVIDQVAAPVICQVTIAPIRSGTYLDPVQIRNGTPLVGTTAEPEPAAVSSPPAAADTPPEPEPKPEAADRVVVFRSAQRSARAALVLEYDDGASDPAV